MLALLGTLASCRTAPEVERVSGAGYDGVIFSVERVRKVFHSTWTPSRSLVARFEDRFRDYVQSDAYARSMRFFIPVLKRQYIGLSDENTGRRVLHVVFLCSDIYVWNREPIAALSDGGSCYCGATYDPRSGKILRFGCPDQDDSARRPVSGRARRAR